ncbi:MAG: hypothetical protein AB8G05_01840 [Oligoflexales bacterium]
MKYLSAIFLIVLSIPYYATANIDENQKKNTIPTPESKKDINLSPFSEIGHRSNINKRYLLGENAIEIQGDVYARDDIIKQVIQNISQDRSKLVIGSNHIDRLEVVQLIYKSFAKNKYYDVRQIDFDECYRYLQYCFYNSNFDKEETYTLGQMIIFDGLDLGSKVEEFIEGEDITNLVKNLVIDENNH